MWGYGALTGLAFLAAHTTTIGLGTFVVQLGSRSPAVMEGWHGLRFARPVQTTRETIEILRIVSRGERLVHDGEVYPLPLPDSRGRAIGPATAPAHGHGHSAATARRWGRPTSG